jgi:hypothetical protein
VSQALFEVLEVQNLIAGGARITLIPPGREMLADLLSGAARPEPEPKAGKG